MALGAMGPITAIKEQTGLVMDKPRWGDYSATHVDPVDDTTMWTIQLIAGASNRYTTWWAKFSDTSSPRVSDAAAIDEITVRLAFDKAMADNLALTDPSAYLFSGGPPALAALGVARVDGKTVDIFVNTMESGISYTVTVLPGPTDLLGTPVDPLENSASFVSDFAPSAPLGDLIEFALLAILGTLGALVAWRRRVADSGIL